MTSLGSASVAAPKLSAMNLRFSSSCGEDLTTDNTEDTDEEESGSPFQHTLTNSTMRLVASSAMPQSVLSSGMMPSSSGRNLTTDYTEDTDEESSGSPFQNTLTNSTMRLVASSAMPQSVLSSGMMPSSSGRNLTTDFTDSTDEEDSGFSFLSVLSVLSVVKKIFSKSILPLLA